MNAKYMSIYAMQHWFHAFEEIHDEELHVLMQQGKALHLAAQAMLLFLVYQHPFTRFHL